MNILIGILIVLEILISILLTLIILVQPSKGGGGLGGALGGGMSEQLFGARTGNVMTKATILFASVFLLNTVALAYLYSRQNTLSYEPPPSPGIEQSAPSAEGGDAGMEGGAAPDSEADAEGVAAPEPEEEPAE